MVFVGLGRKQEGLSRMEQYWKELTFLLPVPSLENKLKWNYLHCNVYSRFLFCLVGFFLSSPTVGTVLSTTGKSFLCLVALLYL